MWGVASLFFDDVNQMGFNEIAPLLLMEVVHDGLEFVRVSIMRPSKLWKYTIVLKVCFHEEVKVAFWRAWFLQFLTPYVLV